MTTGEIIRLRLIIKELEWILADTSVKRPMNERKMLEQLIDDLKVIYNNHC